MAAECLLEALGWKDRGSVDEAARAFVGALLIVRIEQRLANIQTLLTAEK